MTQKRLQEMGLKRRYKDADEFLSRFPDFKTYLRHIEERETKIEPYKPGQKRMAVSRMSSTDAPRRDHFAHFFYMVRMENNNDADGVFYNKAQSVDVLGPDIGISSEWSGTGQGRINFHIPEPD